MTESTGSTPTEPSTPQPAQPPYEPYAPYAQTYGEPSYATNPYARPDSAGTDTLTIAPPAPGAVPPSVVVGCGGPPAGGTAPGAGGAIVRVSVPAESGRA